MSDLQALYAPPTPTADEPFPDATYTIRRPFWSLFGRKFHVFRPDGSLAMFVKHPLMKLRTEFNLHADETETRALATVKARELIALNLTYDVVDPQSGRKLGSLRTRGLKSILRDTWDILDGDGREIGIVEETGLALLRRFFPILLGQWRIEYEGREVGTIRQKFRFFVKEYALALDAGQSSMDPRFAVACGLLALMRESQRERR